MITSRATGVAALSAVLCLAASLSSCTGDQESSDEGAKGVLANAPKSPSSPSSSSAPSDVPPKRIAKAPAQAESTGWGVTAAEVRTARRMVSTMTLPHLAGQVIVARYSGTKAPAALVNRQHLGGVIMMGENIASTDQVRRSNRTLQEAAATAGRRWPVFVGVDQEGGIVERVKGDATRFPTFMTAGAARDPGLTRSAAAASGAELVDIGFTTVFAPVGDVTSGPQDPTIGSRSPGSGPSLVAAQMNAAVDGYEKAAVLPVVKHFPGHGSVTTDSHLALPVQRKSLPRLMRSDLVPFRAAVEQGVPSVMVGHIDVRAVDPGVPSSLSRKVVTGLLRDKLGFRGLVVTDALNMGAVAGRYSSAEAAVRAIRAGNDVLLMPVDATAARDGIVRAVRNGALSRARLEQAAARQVALLRHQRDLRPTVTRRPGGGRAESYRLSAGGVTVAGGPCQGRLVGRSVRATGPGDAVARFNAAAQRAGLDTGAGTTVALVGYGGSARRADVVVSMDTPYVLGASRAGKAKIALYGDTPGAMRALVDVLVGKAKAPGRLPVPVSGVARTGC